MYELTNTYQVFVSQLQCQNTFLLSIPNRVMIALFSDFVINCKKAYYVTFQNAWFDWIDKKLKTLKGAMKDLERLSNT